MYFSIPNISLIIQSMLIYSNPFFYIVKKKIINSKYNLFFCKLLYQLLTTSSIIYFRFENFRLHYRGMNVKEEKMIHIPKKEQALSKPYSLSKSPAQIGPHNSPNAILALNLSFNN